MAIRLSEVTCQGVKYVPLHDDEIAFEGCIFHLTGGRMRPVTNSTYFGKTGIQAKIYQASNGVDFTIYRKFNSSLASHNQMVDSLPSYDEPTPGYPFRSSLFKDKFTIDRDSVERFAGNNSRAMSATDLLPILQQIMTNQKEIMQILNTAPEDKMAEKKFLADFDEKMKEVLKS